MPHFDAALLQQLLHLVGQLHQTQQIADGSARPADRLGRGLVGETELLDEPAQGTRLLQWVQILALNVLDERHGDRRFIGHIADDRRYLRDSRHLRRAPAALAGDDFVALGFAGQVARQRPHQDGLHQSLSLDRIGEFAQGLRAHVHPRLVFAPLQQVQGQAGQPVADERRRFGRRHAGTARQQGTQLREPATQRRLFAGHARIPGNDAADYTGAGGTSSRPIISFGGGTSARRIISPASAR